MVTVNAQPYTEDQTFESIWLHKRALQADITVALWFAFSNSSL